MIASSFAGPNDKRLPPAVRRMAKPMRELWVVTFNAGAGNESAAYKLAWKTVRAAISSKETPGIDDVFVGQEPAQEATMPWKIVEEDGKHCVYKLNEDGSLADKLKCYDDRQEALSYQKALYANVEEKAGPVGDLERLRVLVGAHVTLAGGTAEKRAFDESMVERHPEGDSPTLVSFKAWDQPDGRTRWVLTSSGGFEDRDGEVVSTDFLRSCVAVADRSKERGPLLIFHVPGARIGTCDYQAVVGEPGFLLESGLFDDTPAGRRAAGYYKAHAKETGASIKFLYANLSQDGVYTPPGVILERSLMRRERAAFPWSGLTLSEVNEMAKISREKRAELEAVLGEELAVSILDQLDASAEALKEQGVRAKAAAKPEDDDEDEMEEETTEAAATPDEEEVPVPDEEDEEDDKMEKAAKAPPPVEGGEYELVLTEDALNAVAEKAASSLSAQLDGLAAQLRAALDDVKTLRTVVEKNAQDVQALKLTDEDKIAEKVANLPRATVRRIQQPELYRATQSKQAAEAPEGDLSDPLTRLKNFVHG